VRFFNSIVSMRLPLVDTMVHARAPSLKMGSPDAYGRRHAARSANAHQPGDDAGGQRATARRFRRRQLHDRVGRHGRGPVRAHLPARRAACAVAAVQRSPCAARRTRHEWQRTAPQRFMPPGAIPPGRMSPPMPGMALTSTVTVVSPALANLSMSGNEVPSRGCGSRFMNMT